MRETLVARPPRDKVTSLARRAARLALAGALFACGCGRREARAPQEAPREPFAIPVSVLADSAATTPLAASPPEVRVWVERVAPARSAPLPESPAAAPETLALELPPPPGLEIDPTLKPPIPRGDLVVRLTARGRPAFVELDVRVDEAGDVSDAVWSGGSADSALVRSATDAALALRFHPALQAGRPVAVWCRQRFDFAPRER